MKYMIFFVLIPAFVYFKCQDGRVHVNSQYSCIILLKDGYRSYGVNYSWGETIIDGKWVNLWRKPQFYKTDVRPFIKAGKK